MLKSALAVNLMREAVPPISYPARDGQPATVAAMEVIRLLEVILRLFMIDACAPTPPGDPGEAWRYSIVLRGQQVSQLPAWC